MPAPTISSNTRASRSRYSSPQQPPNSSVEPTAKSTIADGQRTFMQKWLEPPVQVKASYQDAGLMKHGVVEGMAPLGTMPKVGIFKKTAAPAEPPPTRKIILKRPVHSGITPATAPANTAATEDDTEEEDDGDDDEDGEEEEGEEEEEEMIPPPPPPPVTSRRSLTSRDADEDWAPAKAASSGHKGFTRRSVSSRASAGRLGSLSSPSFHQASANSARHSLDHYKEITDKVIEFAVDEALKHFRYPTAWALRTLYDENCNNPEFLSMLEEVYSQTADTDTLTEFARLVHEKKKEGKKDNKGCYYFVPPATNSRFTPHKPKRAPYASLVRLEVPSLRFDRERVQDRGQVPERGHSEAHARKKRKSTKHPESASKMAPNGLNGKSKTDSPLRRKARAESVSSSSSLSSARSMTPPEGIKDEHILDGPGPSHASTAAENSNNAPTAPQPIATRRRPNAAKKNGNVSPTRNASSAASSHQHPPPTAAAKSSMPAAVDLFPNLTSKKALQKGAAQDNNIAFPSRVGNLDEADSKLRLRQKARHVTNGEGVYPESFSRDAVPRDIPRLQFGRPEPEVPRVTVRSRASLPAVLSSTPAHVQTGAPGSLNVRSTRSSRKRSHDEVDDQVSPTTLQFPTSEVASTAANSRAGTPVLRPAKKPRTGLRVKNSPMKKKSGTSAGIPRASGERSSPVANGGATKEDDNDDYCSSCGGNGELVCCDGCIRSFHLTCVDPPLIEDRMPPEWFCNVCLSNRDPAGLPGHLGSFGSLLEKLDVKNSSAFRLPGDVREYFEGVRTGDDGEYEEIVAMPKPARKKKNDEDQIPDFFKLRDNEGNSVICHDCQKPTSDNRAIIPCSLCGLWWHIDCLDPPLANPPVLRTWRCPAHIDDLLAKIPGNLGPAHKFRKIKGAPAIKPVFTRGNINNGHIEIVPDDSEDESGWKNADTFGRTFKLSEKGVKLDFLTRVRENRKGKRIAPLSACIPVSNAQAQRALDPRSLEEQQAARNLVQLQGGSGISTLVDTLLAEASPVVISLIARGDPDRIENDKLSQADQQSLRAMLAQMERTSSRIKSMLLANSAVRSEGLPPLPAEGVREAAISEATRAQPDGAMTGLPADGVDDMKDLPSPAASEDVAAGAEAKGKTNNKNINVAPVAATAEDRVSEEPVLPHGSVKEEADNFSEGRVSIHLPSDGKSAVEEEAMDVE